MVGIRGMLAVTACALTALSSTACASTSTCSHADDYATVPFTDDMLDGNIFHSAPIGGPYTHFPPARTLTFEHHLKAEPYDVQFWLAFSAEGTLAPSAGNMTELRDPADGGLHALNDQTISVYNNTCSDFYLWVVAEGPVGTADPASSDIGAAGASP
jgi:hypothetical protein